jgi:hypothetical protein
VSFEKLSGLLLDLRSEKVGRAHMRVNVPRTCAELTESRRGSFLISRRAGKLATPTPPKSNCDAVCAREALSCVSGAIAVEGGFGEYCDSSIWGRISTLMLKKRTVEGLKRKSESTVGCNIPALIFLLRDAVQKQLF